jgi:hypothetical protein
MADLIRSVEIYSSERFSGHAPLIIGYDYNVQQ